MSKPNKSLYIVSNESFDIQDGNTIILANSPKDIIKELKDLDIDLDDYYDTTVYQLVPVGTIQPSKSPKAIFVPNKDKTKAITGTLN